METTLGELRLRQFAPGDEDAFRRLNEEWITAFFRLEAKDEEVLADPKREVLEKGGHIFFMERQAEDGALEVIGCCALQAMQGSAEYEVSKMAVVPAWRGAGVGRKILEHAVQFARTNGARRLYIETSHRLPNAIHLYESVGFRHLPPERVVPSGYARADVYMEMLLC